MTLRQISGYDQQRVAQVSNLLYRRLPAGWMRKNPARVRVRGGGLEIRDTADWKSALRNAAIRLRSFAEKEILP